MVRGADRLHCHVEAVGQGRQRLARGHLDVEVSPRLCFERNHRQLPFGCHAWARYDGAFWEPHLLKESLAEDKTIVTTKA